MIILGILPRYKLCSISGSPFSAPFSITIRSMNILELSTKRFKHIVTLRVLLDNPETTEAVATTDVGAVAVAMVVVVVRSNSDAGGNSGSDSNSNLLCVNYVYKFGYFFKLNPFFRFQIQVCSGIGRPTKLFHYCTSPTWKYNSTKNKHRLGLE